MDNTLSGESSIKGSVPENTDMSVPPAAVQEPDSPLLPLPECQSLNKADEPGGHPDSPLNDPGIPLLGASPIGAVDTASGADNGLATLDYEPEKKWGSALDLRKHIQYGGNREDY